MLDPKIKVQVESLLTTLYSCARYQHVKYSIETKRGGSALVSFYDTKLRRFEIIELVGSTPQKGGATSDS